MRILLICNNNYIRNNLIYFCKNSDIEIFEPDNFHNIEKLGEIIARTNQLLYVCLPESKIGQNKFWEKNLLFNKTLVDLIKTSKNKIYFNLLFSEDILLPIRNKFLKKLVDSISPIKSQTKIFTTPEIFGKWSNKNSKIYNICQKVINNKKYNLKKIKKNLS